MFTSKHFSILPFSRRKARLWNDPYASRPTVIKIIFHDFLSIDMAREMGIRRDDLLYYNSMLVQLFKNVDRPPQCPLLVQNLIAMGIQFHRFTWKFCISGILAPTKWHWQPKYKIKHPQNWHAYLEPKWWLLKEARLHKYSWNTSHSTLNLDKRIEPAFVPLAFTFILQNKSFSHIGNAFKSTLP